MEMRGGIRGILRGAMILLPALAATLAAVYFGWGLGDNAKKDEPNPMSRYEGKVRAPDFPAGLQWLNTGRPLSIRDLRGKVVLLDFWTYCCINCMHIIPDLKRLEEKYKDELVVIGVHSAKFTTERETDNIRQAILRYEIEHPVVNDADMQVWQRYGAHAWPTLVLIDPAGSIVGSLSGEGVFEAFDSAIAGVIEAFEAKGRIDRRPLNLTTERAREPERLLSFPGKVLADGATRQLFIADSNHNRIVVVWLDDLAVKETIGSGEEGFADGAFEEAAFRHPQGMAFDGKALYVADTENHAIRRIDFDARDVTTVAGTGEQARQFNQAGPARRTPLNSPWDLVLHGGDLYIAMAGSHQLWRLDLAANEVAPYAGTGREARLDGSLANAALAQPSGIATDGRRLYFADSEVSAIRAADLDPKGQVTTIAGGDLFDFGDRDAKGLEARFQHPLGLDYHDGLLYVADTYNNKIKVVSPNERTAETFLGTGEEGLEDGERARFDEPGGVSALDGRLYIADTNNHAIRVADLRTRRVETLAIKGMEKLKPPRPAARFAGETIDLSAQAVRPGATTLTIALALPPGYKLNPLAPSAATVSTADAGVVGLHDGSKQTFRATQFPLQVPVTVGEGRTDLQVEYTLYYCEADKESLCYFKEARLRLPVTAEAMAEPAGLRATYQLAAP